MQIVSFNLIVGLLFYYLSDCWNTVSYLTCNAEPYKSHKQFTNMQEQAKSTDNRENKASTKIIGSRGSGDRKHAVRIALLSDYKTAHCAGAIHNALYIITVAHCVNHVNASQLVVTAGQTTGQLEQNRSVISITIHEDWNPDTSLHDIALLKLNVSLILSVNEVGPVELGQPKLPNGSLSFAWITGWGLFQGGEVVNLTYPAFPRQIKVPLVDRNSCREVYKKFGKVVHEDQICAGGEDGYGPCTGDDGAPLTVKNMYGRFVRLNVVGILSSFQGCATDVPHIYTDMDKYKSWIESKAGRQCDHYVRPDDSDKQDSRNTFKASILQRPRAQLEGSVAQAVCAANNRFIKTRYIQVPQKRSAISETLLGSNNQVVDPVACINWQWNICYECQKFTGVQCNFKSEDLKHVATSSRTARVFGGQNATLNQHPYQIRILVEKDGRINQYACSGVIYNSLYVITSAYCVHQLIPCALTVIAGDHSVSLKDDSEQVRQVVSIITHEKYVHSSLRPYDIALLKMNIPLNLTRAVHSVLLATREYPTADVQMVALSGWGELTWSHNRPDVLQTILIPFIDECECMLEYAYSKDNPINSNTVCVGKLGQGVCDEDLGSPLTVTDNGTTYLVGITSFAAVCGSTAGIATKVYAYRDWIALRAGDISLNSSVITIHG